MSADREYHAIVRGQQQGPLTKAQMVELAVQGQIGPETMAWTDGMTIWRPLPEVPGLDNLLADLPDPSPLGPEESLLPASVDSALDSTSRSQAFIIGAGIFFGLIAILGIGNIFSFRRLALLGFWGSGVLAYFAYQAWRQEEDGAFAESAQTTYRGAIGAWILAVISLAFGNWFFGILQAGAGLLFWLARTELLKHRPEPTADDAPELADGIRPTADGPAEQAADTTTGSEPLEAPGTEPVEEPPQDPLSDV